MRVAIVGAGLIGGKRAASLDKDDNLVIVCDVDLDRAKKLANKYSSRYTTKYEDLINLELDIVIISVVNRYLKNIAITMLNSKCHILCEKPLGLSSKQSDSILIAAKNSKKTIKTGFNHRFHPAIIKAKQIIENKSIGKLLNIRASYGHGGRSGMEKEWRCRKELSGGGELLDQGVHIIDLCKYFICEDAIEVYGKNFTSHWNINVEDNSFFNILFKNGTYAHCHVSWTNWKNIFLFEIFGSNGYLRINGLGGSYGLETLEVGFRNPNGGVPDYNKYDFEDKDSSWSLEWKNFKESINKKSKINGDGFDGFYANKIIDSIYKSNTLNKPILLE